VCYRAHLQWPHPHVVTLQHEKPSSVYELGVLLCCHEKLDHCIGPVLDRKLTPGVTLRLQGVGTEGRELLGTHTTRVAVSKQAARSSRQLTLPATWPN
jgi:hypothetical protein